MKVALPQSKEPILTQWDQEFRGFQQRLASLMLFYNNETLYCVQHTLFMGLLRFGISGKWSSSYTYALPMSLVWH